MMPSGYHKRQLTQSQVDEPQALTLICTRCGTIVTIAHKDDVNTQWYNCPECGYVTSTKPLVLTQQQRNMMDASRIQNEQFGEHYVDPLQIYSRFCDDDDVFKPALAAEWIQANHKFKTDRETGMLYFYDGRVWRKNGENYLKELVAHALGKNDRKSHYENILFHLSALTQETIRFSQKIAVENGLLDVETRQLTPFNPEEMAFHTFPVEYNPEAKCPNWDKFVAQIVAPEDLNTLQEWTGYIILPDYRFHKIAWIQGSGRNGKGAWSRTIEAVIGHRNVSSIGLEEFDGNHRFALEQLHGKLFNICSEPATSKSLQTNLLKKATGQDTISSEIKGRQERRDFSNTAKITVMANRFPRVFDRTTAFKERRLILPFPFEFTGEKQIANIEANWLTINDERSGILNWMLEGLQRLLQQGHFTESRSQREAELEFLRGSDSIGAFLSEMSVKERALTISRKDSFDRYNEYCDALGIPAENERKFNDRVRNEKGVTGCTVTKIGKRERAWKGISFKGITEDGTVTEVTGVTGLLSPNNLSSEKSEEIEIPVTPDTPVTLQTTDTPSKRLTFYVKDIPPDEKCGCGRLAVTEEILTPTKETLRRCPICLEKLRTAFSEADWKPSYPDFSDITE